jgi:hypothetical protein
MASAEDIRYLNVSTNCKQVSGRIPADVFKDFWGTALNSAMLNTVDKIKIFDHVGNMIVYVSSGDITIADGVLTFVSAVAPNPFIGVITVELHGVAADTETTINYDNDGDGTENEDAYDSTLIRRFYTVAGCQIDCCLANLIDSAIECHCHCDKCKEDLLRGEKVFLMLQGSMFAAEQEENYDHAVAMYNKASELCIEVCACGC